MIDGQGFQSSHLARAQIFFGKVPVPVLHIDTTYEFPKMLEFRDWATKQYKLNLDAPYEAPEGAEIVGRTDRQSVDESVATILEQLLPRLKADEPND